MPNLLNRSRPIWLSTPIVIGIGIAFGLAGWWPLLGIIGVVYLAFCAQRPAVALAWSFLILPISLPEFSLAGANTRPFEVVVWPAALIAVVASFRAETPINIRQLGPAIMLLVYLTLDSIVQWGPNSPLEIRRWWSAALFGLACYQSERQVEADDHFFNAIVLSGVMLAAVSASQWLFGGPLYAGYGGPRDLIRLLLLHDSSPVRFANATFPHFNAAASYETLVLLIAYAWWRETRAARAAIGVLCSALALYLSYSRGGAVAALAGVAFIHGITASHRVRVAMTALTLGLIMSTAALALPILFSSEYITTVSVGARLLIWHAYYQAWLASPVFGLGPGNAYHRAAFLSPYGTEYVAHSNYLYLAADFGAVGLVLAVLFFGVALHQFSQKWELAHARDVSRRRALMLGVGATLVALTVHSVVDHTLAVFAYRTALLGVIGLGLRASSAQRGIENE